MDSQDLDRYVTAKRQQRVATCITVVGVVIGAAAGVLLYFGIWPLASRAALIGSALGVLLANGEFGLHGTAVSRAALLEIIERQIYRDPDAIAYLAKKTWPRVPRGAELCGTAVVALLGRIQVKEKMT